MVFFWHGYLGSSQDMERVSGILSLKIKNSRIHSWSTIEEVEDQGIFELGKTVADEIRYEIEKALALGELNTISFIGHSMGGLVLRAALEYLEEFKEYFNIFMTLATPHLGYMHSKSRLVSIGMWAISRMSKNPTLSELRLTDNTKDIKSCTIYKLSSKPGLDWFKTVLIVGSLQDNYAPIETSMIKLSENMEKHYLYDDYSKMWANLYKRLKKTNVYRIYFSFEFLEGSIDTYIGRMAHIQFLDNADVIRMLAYRYFD